MRSLFIYIFLTLLIGQVTTNRKDFRCNFDAKTGETLPRSHSIILNHVWGQLPTSMAKSLINNVPPQEGWCLLASYVSYTNKKIAFRRCGARK